MAQLVAQSTVIGYFIIDRSCVRITVRRFIFASFWLCPLPAYEPATSHSGVSSVMLYEVQESVQVIRILIHLVQALW
jgi:hypothetical protein